MKKLLTPLYIFLLTAALTACGGGGSGTAANGGGTTVQPASVSLVLTDASIEDWDQALATITSVELIGDDDDDDDDDNGGRHVLFEGEETVDLLRLRDFTEVFAIDEGVTPGTYEKIRLRVSRLLFVRLDADGFVEEEQEADLVANGKIDLNPRDDIEIGPGDVLFITLDFDMDKSFKLIETGNGKLKVRPVIFVRIGTEPGFRGLARVRGVIEMTSDDLDGFLLCETELVALPLSHDDDDEYEEEYEEEYERDDDYDHDDDRYEGCLRVVVDAETGVFDINGLPLDAMMLEAGDAVTVIGRLGRRMDDPEIQPVSDDDGDDEYEDSHEPFALQAFVIEEGPEGAWSRIAGTALGAIVDDSFDLAVAPSQGFVEDTVIASLLSPGTRLFTPRGEELERDAVVAGRRVLVDAVLALSQTENDVLRTALIVVGDDDARDELSGELLSVDEETLTVATDAGDRCVNTEDAIILQLDAETLDLTEINVGELVTGQELEIFGEDDSNGVNGCFEAEVVIAKPLEAEPLPAE